MKQRDHWSTEIEQREPMPSHKQVFLCYCHKDLRYAQRLRVHLAGCQQIARLTVWDGSQIQTGLLWKSEIASALSTAHFAVLLVSANFLASSFIATFELPRLLAAAQSGGTRILPVIVDHCLFKESSLAVYQASNDPARPLSRLTTAVRDEIWVSVVRTLIHTPIPTS